MISVVVRLGSARQRLTKGRQHGCGYKLANDGHDTRSLQAYLGHKNIQHTVRYSELSRPGPRIFGAKPAPQRVITQAAC
jgi:type 1 fimbriae regulatory protein FimB/type 1 fimbriae regulatory protein FimE